MAAVTGRQLVLKIENSAGSGTYTTIGSFTDLSVTINATTVDITNKSSGGWQELLEQGGTKSVAFTGSGIYIEGTQQALLLTNMKTDDIYNYQIVYGASSATVTGAFKLESITLKGGTADAQTFDVSATSTGTVTFA